MNKLDMIRARARIITEANQRAEDATDTFSVRLANAPAQVSKAADPLAARVAYLSSPAGKSMKEAPYAEVTRIVNLPVIYPMDEGENEEYNRQNILANAYESNFRFFPVQAEALSAYDMYAGGFFPISVGGGKTGVTLAIAHKAYAKGLKKILLIVPSQVFQQLVAIDIRWARSKIPLSVPIHILGGRDGAARRALTTSGKKGLYIMPYSYLSVKDTSEMLEGIKPELIICDEAHNLANRTSARTRRLMAYVDKYKPEGVLLSGTITSKTIRDYFHLIKWALKENNPLPNSTNLANEWSTVIDAVATGTYGDAESRSVAGATGPLSPLIQWAQKNFPQDDFSQDIRGFRKAYKTRLNTAPGVVSSGESTLGTSLTMANSPVLVDKEYLGMPALEKFRRKVTDEWLTPNGDEIEHAIHCYKWLYELSAGFYNELSWPTAEVYAKRKKISELDAADILAKSVVHHAAGQVYASALRKWLQEKSKPGVDTPMLVGNSMSQHGARDVGQDLFDLWRDWKGLDFEGRPDRDSRAVRVCDYKIVAAVAWAKSLEPDKGAIMWVWHQEIGQWLYDELVKAGIPAMHCPAGDKHNSEIIDIANGNRVVVASMSAHGTGKNLQHFSENYFVQWPRQATQAEQTIGRTHRYGQKADELTINTNLTLEFDQLNFAACLNDSLYIHQTTGNRQKLIYANYNPLPKIFPSAVLVERGMQNRLLSRDQEQLMKERFSNE